jgi:hypothetical protein
MREQGRCPYKAFPNYHYHYTGIPNSDLPRQSIPPSTLFCQDIRLARGQLRSSEGYFEVQVERRSS